MAAFAAMGVLFSTTHDKLRKSNERLAKAHAALDAARDNLERRVDERTAELREATDRLRRSEETLRRSETGLRKVQSIARLGSWTWTTENNRVEWSDEMFEIFGIDRATFQGDLDQVVSDAIHPDDRGMVEAANRSVMRDGLPVPLEYRVVLPGGDERFVWAEAGERILDGEGRIVALSGYAQDVTERKRREAEKKALEDQLRHAQRLESIGQLAGGVAHDFNNMLTIIIGHAQIALRGLEPDQQPAGDLREILDAANRSAALTRQMLAFARKQPVNPKVFDLNSAVRDTGKMLKRLIGEDIDLQIATAGEPLPVRMDPAQVGQVLANLCVNARDAIGGVGTVSIGTGCAAEPSERDSRTDLPPGEYVTLTVRDTGCGMDHETLDRLFEPFFTTKGLGKGTGLGLATVHGIVRQNGGSIDVDSRPGEGTTFRILLPRHDGPIEPDGRAGAHPPRTGGDETILLVEDERNVLNLSRTMLLLQGFNVIAADTPEEALRIAETHPGTIDLLLTDLVMPKMSGTELTRRIRALRPGIRIAITSGYTDDLEALQEELAAGVPFIPKPFTPAELALGVRIALERDPGQPPPT